MLYNLIFVLLLCSFITVQSQDWFDNVPQAIFPRVVYDEIASLGQSDQIDPEVIADSKLTLLELIRKKNYTVTEHTVQTDDGYLVTLYRMEDSPRRTVPRRKTPVLLVPGLCGSSAIYVVLGPEHSLSYYLSDRGYDVWLANFRDSRLSGKHIHWKVHQTQYWQFSFHEFGVSDIPAMIDHIIEQTNVPKIQLIGYSQGTTAFFVMASERPNYNDKVLSMHALAPVVYESEMTNPLVVLYRPFYDSTLLAWNFMNLGEISFTNQFGVSICKVFFLLENLCENIVLVLVNGTPDKLKKALAPVISAHLPESTSVKMLAHHAQHVQRGKFNQFDYGLEGNIEAYNSSEPPDYDLSLITSRVQLIYSNGDGISVPSNVKLIQQALPNVAGVYKIPDDQFGHTDFVISQYSKTLLHDQLFASMVAEDERSLTPDEVVNGDV